MKTNMIWAKVFEILFCVLYYLFFAGWMYVPFYAYGALLSPFSNFLPTKGFIIISTSLNLALTALIILGIKSRKPTHVIAQSVVIIFLVQSNAYFLLYPLTEDIPNSFYPVYIGSFVIALLIAHVNDWKKLTPNEASSSREN